MKELLIAFAVILLVADSDCTYHMTGCDLFISEVYNPTQWLESEPACAYIGIGIPHRCVTEQIPFQKHLLLIGSVTPESISGAAMYKFKARDISTYKNDDFRKMRGGNTGARLKRGYNARSVYKTNYYFSNGLCGGDMKFDGVWKGDRSLVAMWVNSRSLSSKEGASVFFAIYDNSTSDQDSYELPNSFMRSRNLESNAISDEIWAKSSKYFKDFVVTVYRGEGIKNYNKLAVVFPAAVPQIVLAEQMKKADFHLSVVRCFDVPSDASALSRFKELSLKYFMPLWSFAPILPRTNADINEFCGVSSSQVTVFNIDAQDIGDLHTIYASSRFSNMEPANVDSVTSVPDVSATSASEGDGCAEASERALSQCLQRMERSEAYVTSVCRQSERSRIGMEQIKTYLRRDRGFREMEDSTAMQTACVSYFSSVRNIEARCAHVVSQYHQYVEVFLDASDHAMSKMRGSLESHGMPPPTMNCRPFQPVSLSTGDATPPPPSRPIFPDLGNHEDEDIDEDDEQQDIVDDMLDLEDDFEDDEEEEGEGVRVRRGVSDDGAKSAAHGRKRKGDKINNKETKRGSLAGKSTDNDDKVTEADVGDEGSSGNSKGVEDHSNLPQKVGKKKTVEDFVDVKETEDFQQMLSMLQKKHEPQIKTMSNQYSQMFLQEGVCFSRFKPDLDGWKNFLKNMRRFFLSPKHKRAVITAEREVEEKMETLNQHEDSFELTKKFVVQVFYALQENVPAQQHQKITLVQAVNGVDIGASHFSRKSFREAAVSISYSLHRNVIEKIIRDDVGFSLMIDGSQDKSQLGVAVVQLRTVMNNYPLTVHWDLLGKVGDKATDYLKVIIKSIEAAVIIRDKADETPFLEHFTSKMISVTTDGASTMTRLWVLLDQFNAEYGKHDKISLPPVWCHAHFFERVIDKMSRNEIYFKLMKQVVQITHRLFNTESYSKTRHMWRTMSEDFNGDTLTFGAFFEVRWVSSFHHNLKRILENYGVILEVINHELVTKKKIDTDFYSPKVKQLLVVLHHVLSDERVYIRMTSIYNLLTEFMKTSTFLQFESLTIADAEMELNSTFNRIDHHWKTIANRNPMGYQCVDLADGGNTKISCSSDFIDSISDEIVPNSAGQRLRIVIPLSPRQELKAADWVKLVYGENGKGFVYRLSSSLKNADAEKEDMQIVDRLVSGMSQKLKTLRSASAISSSSSAEHLIDIEEHVEAYVSTNAKVTSFEKNPLISLYYSVKFGTHKTFKTEFLKDMIEERNTKLENSDVPLLHYYAVSSDFLADAVDCPHVMDGSLSSQCPFALIDKAAELRGFPFYSNAKNIPQKGNFDFSKRLQVVHRSVQFFKEKLNLPTLLDDYTTWISQFSSSVSSIPSEEASKCVLSLQEGMSRSLPGAKLIQCILNHTSLLKTPNSVLVVLRNSLIPSPSTASVERSFSHMNAFKTFKSTRMKFPIANARMRIITNGPSINVFDPTPAASLFLKSSQPVTRNARSNALTAVKAELNIPYDKKKVLLQRGSKDLQYVDTNYPYDDESGWVEKQKQLQSLQYIAPL